MVADEIARRHALTWAMAPAQLPETLVVKKFGALGAGASATADGPVTAAIVDGLARFGTNIVQPRPDLIALRTETDAVVPAIVSWLVQQGVRIHAVQPRRRSLEDVFLDVMGDDERPG